MSAPVERIIRVFLAHTKDLPDGEIVRLKEQVHLLVQGTKLGQGMVAAPTVVSARDSYLEFEARHGAPVNWDLWMTHITDPTTFQGDEPRYHVFVVPDAYFGRATAGLLRLAQKKGRLIRYLSPETGRLVKVQDIRTINAGDWKRGWAVVTA